jgi:hypothetical protein
MKTHTVPIVVSGANRLTFRGESTHFPGRNDPGLTGQPGETIRGEQVIGAKRPGSINNIIKNKHTCSLFWYRLHYFGILSK